MHARSGRHSGTGRVITCIRKARRKADAEVGVLGVWAYNTRTLLELSVEEVIESLPTRYTAPTLRKVEGGSAKPGVRMWRELGALYARLADARAVAIDAQPRLRPESEPEPLLDQRAMLLMIMKQGEMIDSLLGEFQRQRHRQELFDEQILELLAAVTGTRPVREEQRSGSGREAPVGTAR